MKESVVKIIERLQSIWHTRIELFTGSKIQRSEPIKIKRGFFQGDSLSPIGFCAMEIPLGMMLEEMPGYFMGCPNQRNTKVNKFYFIDDLKVVQSREAELKNANEVVKSISRDMDMKFVVKKCAEIVYKRGKMVKGDGLSLTEGRIAGCHGNHAFAISAECL